MDLLHPLLVCRGVEHGFGTRVPDRDGGSSPEVVTLSQVHKTAVLDEKDSKSGSPPPAGDGVYSGPGGRHIGVWTADCMPVLLASPSGEHVAALHAGWRGAAAGIIREGVRHLSRKRGCLPREILAVMGPSIGPCCYEVGPDVWSAVAEGTPEYRPRATRTFDIRELVSFQLEMAGLSPENVGSLPLCTRCHSELFYSHRGMGSDRKGRSMLNHIRPRS